jgi:hypothetical protein
MRHAKVVLSVFEKEMRALFAAGAEKNQKHSQRACDDQEENRGILKKLEVNPNKDRR